MSPGLLLCTKCDVGVSFSLWMCSNSILRRAGGCHLLTLIHSLMLYVVGNARSLAATRLEPRAVIRERDTRHPPRVQAVHNTVHHVPVWRLYYTSMCSLPVRLHRLSCLYGETVLPVVSAERSPSRPADLCTAKETDKEDHPTQIACRQRGGPVTIVCGIETYAR